MGYGVELHPKVQARFDRDEFPDYVVELFLSLVDDQNPLGAQHSKEPPYISKIDCGDYRVIYQVDNDEGTVHIATASLRPIIEIVKFFNAS